MLIFMLIILPCNAAAKGLSYKGVEPGDLDSKRVFLYGRLQLSLDNRLQIKLQASFGCPCCECTTKHPLPSLGNELGKIGSC